MFTIYKYPFPIEDRFTLAFPVGAIILKAECQGGVPCVWVMVRLDRDTEERHFRIFGTGQPIDDEVIRTSNYIETFQQGPFVWHLFESFE